MYPSGTRSLSSGEDLGSDAPMIGSTIENGLLALKLKYRYRFILLADISDLLITI